MNKPQLPPAVTSTDMLLDAILSELRIISELLVHQQIDNVNSVKQSARPQYSPRKN